jgi:hypothetical protein
MKLRIRGNSVRIRVTRSEVARLAAGKRVEQATQFSASSKLTSSIEGSAHVASPTATFDGLGIAVLLPLQLLRQWAESDDVSIQSSQATGADAPLQLLVEKDFECVHSRAECDDDAYPNPRKAQSAATPGLSR